MKRRRYNVLAVAAIVAAGITATATGVAVRSEDRAPEQPVRKIVNVSVEPVTAMAVEDRLTLSGSIEPWEEVLLSAEASGKIQKLDLDTGDRVSKGQQLVIIERDRTNIHLKRARARFQLAELEWVRVQELHDEGIASSQELDRAKIERDAAQSEVETLEVDLRSRVIRAPFDGIVDRVYPNENEFVTVGSPLISLIQVDRLKLIVRIPDHDISYFAPGDPVRVVVDAQQGKRFDGAIHLISARAGRDTHTFETEIALDNPARELRPGMIARAVLVRERYADSLTIPVFSIISDNDAHYVFVEQNGVAQKRLVEVGLYQSNIAVIRKGLAAGDRLIVAGHRNLQDNTLVRVQTENDR